MGESTPGGCCRRRSRSCSPARSGAPRTEAASTTPVVGSVSAFNGLNSGDHHRVVVVGGGFGGLQAVLKLRRAPVEITLIDRRNFHLFQPLVYQVATGALSPAEVASPLRAIFKGQQNVHVLLAAVTGFDLERRLVTVEDLPNGDAGRAIPYDTLIVAGGSSYSYF